MSYEVVLSERAAKALRKLDRGVRDRVLATIEQLAEEPRPVGCKRLSNSPFYRVRVGDYRVVYDVEDAVVRVTVVKLGHRREVYQRS